MVIPDAGDPGLGSEVNEITGKTVALIVVVLLTTPLQAAGEEYAFRGYLLQAVGALSRRSWVAILVSATLFAMAHGLQNPPLFFDRFMFGAIAAWLVIRTGGLEAGIALHVLNNLLAFGGAILLGDVSDMLNVSEISWWNVPVTLTQSAVYVALVLLVARRMGIDDRTRPPASAALEGSRAA
jgi:membrane protease YdiL (CAAX protease family)